MCWIYFDINLKVTFGANNTKIYKCHIDKGWFIVQRNVSNLKFDIWFCGVTVSTLDSESSDPSSNLAEPNFNPYVLDLF